MSFLQRTDTTCRHRQCRQVIREVALGSGAALSAFLFSPLSLSVALSLFFMLLKFFFDLFCSAQISPTTLKPPADKRKCRETSRNRGGALHTPHSVLQTHASDPSEKVLAELSLGQKGRPAGRSSW